MWSNDIINESCVKTVVMPPKILAWVHFEISALKMVNKLSVRKFDTLLLVSARELRIGNAEMISLGIIKR